MIRNCVLYWLLDHEAAAPDRTRMLKTTGSETSTKITI